MKPTRDRVKVDEKYYVLLEEEYLKQVREISNRKAISNCRLTLTYTKEVGGSRYHLRIHNQRFDRLNDIERRPFLTVLVKWFRVEGCSLYQNITDLTPARFDQLWHPSMIAALSAGTDTLRPILTAWSGRKSRNFYSL